MTENSTETQSALADTEIGVQAEDAPFSNGVQEPSGVNALAEKERLQALFERLKIVRVVVVDDAVELALDAAFLDRVLSESPDAKEGAKPFFPEIDLTGQNTERFTQIESVINHLPPDHLAELGKALAKYHRGAADLEVSDSMRELIPDDIELSLLTPSHWSKDRDTLLGQTTENARTLFLFDQELNADRTEQGFTKGSDIIRELSQTQKDAFGTRWFCGILSHTLQRGAEISEWRKLGKAEKLELEFFMPIAKENLDAADAFYGAVYQTLINIYTERMKGIAQTAFKDALEGALAKFADLEPLDFEHMIVKSSEVEGVSELETLLRLHSIIHRDEVKVKVLSAQTLDGFLKAVGTVKEVAGHERSLPPASFKRLSNVRHQELYEDDSLINDFYDPIRNGDLFAFQRGAGALKVWVLIAQPCDLAVRTDGKRARKDYFKLAVLAPVKKRALGAPQDGDQGLMFELQHFDHGGAQEAWVKFAEATPIDLRVLDLSATTKTGTCEIDALNPVPKGLPFPSISWKNRLGVLHSFFAQKAAKIEEARTKFGPDAAACLADALLPPVSPDPSFAKFGEYQGGKFIYHIRRCGRVREPQSTALLGALTRYLSRDAREHDFSKALSA